MLNEVAYLLRAALRLAVEEEVANAAEQHELGAMLPVGEGIRRNSLAAHPRTRAFAGEISV